jgi:hypothetical protein
MTFLVLGEGVIAFLTAMYAVVPVGWTIAGFAVAAGLTVLWWGDGRHDRGTLASRRLATDQRPPMRSARRYLRRATLCATSRRG